MNAQLSDIDRTVGLITTKVSPLHPESLRKSFNNINPNVYFLLTQNTRIFLRYTLFNAEDESAKLLEPVPDDDNNLPLRILRSIRKGISINQFQPPGFTDGVGSKYLEKAQELIRWRKFEDAQHFLAEGFVVSKYSPPDVSLELSILSAMCFHAQGRLKDAGSQYDLCTHYFCETTQPNTISGAILAAFQLIYGIQSGLTPHQVSTAFKTIDPFRRGPMPEGSLISCLLRLAMVYSRRCIPMRQWKTRSIEPLYTSSDATKTLTGVTEELNRLRNEDPEGVMLFGQPAGERLQSLAELLANQEKESVMPAILRGDVAGWGPKDQTFFDNCMLFGCWFKV